MKNSDKNTTESSVKEESKSLWKPGQSGNPKGRPKGSKNKLSLLREAVLESAEDIVLRNFEDIVQSTVELAKQGDATALKIVWDRIIPAKRTVEDKVEGEDKMNISISIVGMEVAEIGGEKVETNVVEADYTEIKND